MTENTQTQPATTYRNDPATHTLVSDDNAGAPLYIPNGHPWPTESALTPKPTEEK